MWVNCHCHEAKIVSSRIRLSDNFRIYERTSVFWQSIGSNPCPTEKSVWDTRAQSKDKPPYIDLVSRSRLPCYIGIQSSNGLTPPRVANEVENQGLFQICPAIAGGAVYIHNASACYLWSRLRTLSDLAVSIQEHCWSGDTKLALTSGGMFTAIRVKFAIVSTLSKPSSSGALIRMT